MDVNIYSFAATQDRLEWPASFFGLSLPSVDSGQFQILPGKRLSLQTNKEKMKIYPGQRWKIQLGGVIIFNNASAIVKSQISNNLS